MSEHTNSSPRTKPHPMQDAETAASHARRANTDPMNTARTARPHEGARGPICGAATRNSGRPCRKAPLRGATRCALHGGASPQALAAAEKRLARQEAVQAVAKLGLPADVGPETALLDEVRRCAGLVAYYEAKVQEIADRDSDSLVWGQTKNKIGGDDRGQTFEAKPNVWLQLWNEERDRLTRTCAAAIRAGIEERRVRIEEQQGILVAAVIRRILTRLNLTDAQAALVPTVVPEELRSLSAEPKRPQLEVVK